MPETLLTAQLLIELLSLADEGKPPPTSFRLFRKGVNDTLKGKLHYTAKSEKTVLAAAADYGNELAIDYGHAMHMPIALDPAASGRAAGWFTLSARDGELWADNVRWTKRAQAMLSEREYRYTSPVVEFDKEREIVAIRSCALTNIPATKHLAPLVLSQADDSQQSPPPPKEAPRMKSLLLALGLPETATEAEAVAKFSQMQMSAAQLVALSSASDLPSAVAVVAGWKQAADELPKAQAKLAQVESERTESRKRTLIDEGKKAGKIAPASEAFIASLSVEQIEKFLATAPVVGLVAGSTKEEKESGKAGTSSLSQEELLAVQLMGVTPEELEQAKVRVGPSPFSAA